MVRSTLIYGLLLQAAAIQAVRIPAGLADGSYSISFDSVTGATIANPILPLSIESRSDAAAAVDLHSSAKFRRQQNPPALPTSTTKCNSNNINITDFQVAKDRLLKECDKG